MDSIFETVAGNEQIPELSADDAQTVEEVSIEELAGNLADGNNGKEGEHDGDASQPKETQQESDNQQADKFDRRIKTALHNQRKQIFTDLGMTEDEVRAMIRERKAQAMHKNDPDISLKAAQRIIEAEERQQPAGNSLADEYRKGIATLMEDGWTREELQAFSTDESVRQNLSDGMTLRQAARAWLRGNTQKQEARRSVPRMRAATASDHYDEDRISRMTDEQFAAFDKQVEAAILAGKRVLF